MRSHIGLLAVALVILSASIMAVSVPLMNAGFEDDDVPAGNYMERLPSGWTAWGAGGYFPSDGDVFAGSSISSPHNGEQYLIIHKTGGHVGIKQQVPVEWGDLKAGEKLTLKAWVTYRNDVGHGNVYMWLNDSDVSGLYTPFDITDGGATGPGVWTERVWEYTVTQANIDAGWGPIEIQIGHFGDPQVAYDDVSLEYSGQLPAVALASLKEFQEGVRVGPDVTLSWQEVFPGTLINPAFDIYLDPNETKVEAMDSAVLVSSRQTAYYYSPVLENGTRYYWRVATYLHETDTEPNQATRIGSFMTVYDDEHWSGSAWTDDSNIEVGAGKFYTHKVNFNASQSTTTYVNGVHFENDTDRTGR